MRIAKREIAKCELLNPKWEMGDANSNYQHHEIINGECEMQSTKC